ncbi:MAG TPA: ISL3 family transposase [Candidatus Dormibacteraeota bacterium]
MPELELFQTALGLTPPWRVVDSAFDAQAGQLTIELDFPRGSRFPCPTCQRPDCPIHDVEPKRWRHLNFWQYETILTARLPRIRCEQCGVLQVEVSWARPGSGFTVLFEALVLTLAKEMPVHAIGRLFREHDNRLWRIIHFHIDRARAKEDFSQVRRLGVDETSRRRGHHYASMFVDLDRPRAIFCTEGRDLESFGRFTVDFEAHGGRPAQLTELCMDMAPSYRAGAAKYLPQVPITFDRYHLMQNLNHAMDLVRRAEQEVASTLKKSRYLWLTNPRRLSAGQRRRLAHLRREHRDSAEAYRLKLAFADFYEQPADAAEVYLAEWVEMAILSGLDPMADFACSVAEHWDGVVRWFNSKVSNGVLEAISSLVQAAKRRARGYRTTRNLVAVVYLAAGKLNFSPAT